MKSSFGWATTNCVLAVPVAPSCGDSVSVIMIPIRRLRDAGARKNLFKVGPVLPRPDGGYTSARNRSPKVYEAVQFLSYSI